MAEDLLTAGKIAEKLGVPVAKVNKYIKENEVEPDKTKGACKYYGASKQKVIAKGVK
jgi:plasmid maintenance system antidote protein VapI